MTPLAATARALAAYPYGRDPTGDVLETRDAFEKRILAALQAVEREVLERQTVTIRELHWMARRYCDGRMSTAPASFNIMTRELLAAGIELQEPLFARDGMGRSYDGLTADQAKAAENDMPRGHAVLEAEWIARTLAVERATIERCIAAVSAEDMVDETDDPTDATYSRAIRDCKDVIRALLPGERAKAGEG